MADLTFRIDPAQLGALFGRLDRATAIATLRPAMERSLVRMQRDLQTYPPPARKPQPFKSDKQRRFVMAMLREGKIPYKRTGHLGRSWHRTIEARSQGLVGRIGNAQPYAPLVQGAATQAGYHQGTWTTEQHVFDSHRRAIEDDFRDVIAAALAGQ